MPPVLSQIVQSQVKIQSIKACPCNLQLAEFIQPSKIKEAVGLKLTYRTEHVAPKGLQVMSFLNYETRQVMDGISEKQGQYETAICLTISTKELLMPVCAMVVAIIPTTFGLYLLRYSCSSVLDSAQKEYWDPKTFTARTLQAISFKDNNGTQIPGELQDLFPQLVSFLAESCSARKIYLRGIGVTGESLL
jgi:hypothetical protein